MNDQTLVDFLEERIAQFKGLEALAKAALKAAEDRTLDDEYRTFMEQVREAKEAAEKLEKRMHGTNDPRIPWLHLVVSALLGASSGRKPPVNSRDFAKVFDAAYQMKFNVSNCLDQLERHLATLKEQPESRS